MPNLAKTLKEEITRIARKEVRAITGPLHRMTIRLRRDVSMLKKNGTVLDEAVKRLQTFMVKVEAARAVSQLEPSEKGRITAKGMRSLRRRLGLSQFELGELLGVTNVAVGYWERHNGVLRVRKGTRAAILAVRGIGAKEAKVRLAAIRAEAARKSTAKSVRRRRKTRPGK